ncbi:MAG: hypothetical protein INR67_17270 [Jatrophihabitans endophyticus]|nr:hypothetical protein [Jatrophihabitans endophyticus]
MPTWDEVCAAEYAEWDSARDGPRLAVDTSDSARAVTAVLALLGHS